MKKQELVSFNTVVRDVSTLAELDDAQLDQVVGGYASDELSICSTDAACEPNCRCNSACPTLA